MFARTRACLGRTVAALALVAVTGAAGLPAGVTHAQTPYPSGFDAQALEFHRMINEYRAATTNGGQVHDSDGSVLFDIPNGDGVARPELKIDAALQRAAYWHAVNLMLVKKCQPGAGCDHVDSLGNDAGVRIRNYDFAYKGMNYGENVNSYTPGQRFAPTGSVAFQLWKSSPGHNTNMLRETFEWHGIARACTDQLCIWVNTFGGNGDDNYTPFDTASAPAAVPLPSAADAQSWVTRAKAAADSKKQAAASRANNFPAALNLQGTLMGSSYTTNFGNLFFSGGGGRFGPDGAVAEIRGTLTNGGDVYTLNADVLDGKTVSGKATKGGQTWPFEMTFADDTAASFAGKITGLKDGWTGKMDE